MNIRIVSAEDKTLNSLLQNYEKEFSRITRKVPNQNGIFSLDVDLLETDNFLLYDNEIVIGFCIKGIWDNLHDIYEFYVIPSRRNNKIGRKFAQEIFGRYKGRWQVRQIDGADKATSFWRKTISEFTRNNYQESVIKDKYWGKITRQLFISK